MESRERFPREWLFALLFLLPGPLQGSSLTFGQALELALHRNPNAAGHTAAADNTERLGQSASQRFCPIHLENYAAIAAQLASGNEMGLSPGAPRFSAPAETSAGAFEIRSPASVILCTALLYEKLDGIESQQLVLRQQQDYVRRLIEIESRRVSAEVDHPLLLAQAKLFRARTRMEWAALSASARKTRAALSVLVGLSVDQVDPIEGSMPLLPDNLTTTAENVEAIQLLLDYRDIVQLDYVSEYMSRLKATHDMALAKASIGALVAAHVTEEMKFISLLEVNNQIREARIQFLGESYDLEAWAFGRANHNAILSSAPPGIQASDSSAPSPNSTSGIQSPSLLSILIAPAIKELQLGKSQQYSAIATWSDGHARDVTSEANWTCSSDTAAVVSSTGLLTALAVGAITIHAKFQGIEHSRKLSIAEQPVDEYLLPDHRVAAP